MVEIPYPPHWPVVKAFAVMTYGLQMTLGEHIARLLEAEVSVIAP
jgi:hypothetical protein